LRQPPARRARFVRGNIEFRGEPAAPGLAWHCRMMHRVNSWQCAA